MIDTIKSIIRENIKLKESILRDGSILRNIEQAAQIILAAYHNGKKVILCGNGGSASDAQHIEGELVGRFETERKALPAIAIASNSATLTAIGNDYGFDNVFLRQIEAHAKQGDVLIVFSASGNSANIVSVLVKAKELDIKTIGFLGRGGGKCGNLCTVPIIVPHGVTARIQECHIMIGHIICHLIDSEFKKL